MSADGGNGLQPAGVRVISILARTQGDASGLEEVLSALAELRETLSSESTAANLPIVFERWAFHCLEVLDGMVKVIKWTTLVVAAPGWLIRLSAE